MKRREIVKVAGGMAAFATLSSLSCKKNNSGEKWNFVFIMVDDLGWTGLGS